MKMKTTIVLHDVYCAVTYPEYLHVRNRYILQKPYVLYVFFSIGLLNLKKCNRTTASRRLIFKSTDFIIKYDIFILQSIQGLNVARKIP